jgi:hypothetical protein
MFKYPSDKVIEMYPIFLVLVAIVLGSVVGEYTGDGNVGMVTIFGTLIIGASLFVIRLSCSDEPANESET